MSVTFKVEASNATGRRLRYHAPRVAKFAFVEFSDAAVVRNVILRLDDTELRGRMLKVNEARERAPRTPADIGPLPFLDDGPRFRPTKPRAAAAAFAGGSAGSGTKEGARPICHDVEPFRQGCG